jgi:hypothetical protein
MDTEQDLDFCEVCNCIIPEGRQHIAARHLSLHGCSVFVGVVRGFLWKWYKKFVQ